MVHLCPWCHQTPLLPFLREARPVVVLFASYRLTYCLSNVIWLPGVGAKTQLASNHNQQSKFFSGNKFPGLPLPILRAANKCSTYQNLTTFFPLYVGLRISRITTGSRSDMVSIFGSYLEILILKGESISWAANIRSAPLPFIISPQRGRYYVLLL